MNYSIWHGCTGKVGLVKDRMRKTGALKIDAIELYALEISAP